MVLDDAVMHDGDGFRFMRMRVTEAGRAVGRPAGVPDAGFSRQRIMDEQVAEIGELSHRAASREPTVRVHRGDAGAVIASVFEPLERIDHDRRGFVPTKDSDDSTHVTMAFDVFPSIFGTAPEDAAPRPAWCPVLPARQPARRPARPW